MFLSLFPPLGLGLIPPPKLYLHTFAYGVLCAGIMLCNFLALPRLFPHAFAAEQWNVGRHVAFSAWLAFTVALGNVAYSVWNFHFQASLSTLLLFLGVTLLIGLFPTTILTLMQERRFLRQNIDAAQRLSAHLQHQHHQPQHNQQSQQKSAITPDHTSETFSQKNHLSFSPSSALVFEGASSKERFETAVDNLLCLQSSDNYVTIFALADDDTQTVMLRMTLKSAQERTQAHRRIVRCHKSYIVNLDHVRDISGNAQGYKLHIPTLDFPVPVSRSYQDKVLQALEY